MDHALRAGYLADIRTRFRALKDLADGALSQVTDGEIFHQPDPESNSLAVLLQHMGGNLRSRWTDFLESDGEKPDRDRDGEFVVRSGTSRGDVLQVWENGWRCAFDALDSLRPEDLGRSVRIRGESHTVPEAIHRQLAHAAYHVGQIVYLAKHYRAREWRTLSIPRGESEAFTQRLAASVRGAGSDHR